MLSLFCELVALINFGAGMYFYIIDSAANWHMWLFHLVTTIIMLMYANRYEKD